jgi:thioredoxin
MFRRRTKARKINHLSELDELAASGKPVLVDFMQPNCAPCRVMDGIVNEISDEYGESAHVVKVDVQQVEGAAMKFKIRSTPTLIVLAKPPVKKRKKVRPGDKPAGEQTASQRWRTTGLVKKDQLERILESNGASRV